MRSVCLAVLAFPLWAGCSKDAQTEEAVRTEAAGGEASTSISGDSADKREVALVRVVNAAASSPSVTVRADEGRSLPAAEYKGVTPYQQIDKNWVKFEIGRDGTYGPLETNREMLADGHRYTLVVMSKADGDGYRTRVLRDEISSDQSRAHVRVIHAAAGIDEVDVVARGGETLFDGINEGSEAGFKDVMPWAGTLEVRDEDDKRAILTIPNVDWKAGVSYTIVVTRASARGKTEAFVFEDQAVGR